MVRLACTSLLSGIRSVGSHECIPLCRPANYYDLIVVTTILLLRLRYYDFNCDHYDF